MAVETAIIVKNSPIRARSCQKVREGPALGNENGGIGNPALGDCGQNSPADAPERQQILGDWP
jgi:hypothetical protein